MRMRNSGPYLMWLAALLLAAIVAAHNNQQQSIQQGREYVKPQQSTTHW